MDSANNTVELNAALNLMSLRKNSLLLTMQLMRLALLDHALILKRLLKSVEKPWQSLASRSRRPSVILLLAHCLIDFTRIALYLMRLIAHRLKFCAAIEASW